MARTALFTNIALEVSEQKLKNFIKFIIIIIIIIIIISVLLLLLPTAIELSLGGSSPYTSTDKTNKNKYTEKERHKNTVQTTQNTVNTKR